MMDVERWCDCRGGRLWASILGLLSTLVAVSGVVLVPVGQRWHYQASLLTPETDFISLGVNCQVTDVKIEQVSEQLEKSDAHGGGRGDNVCFHHYIYSFVYAGTGAFTFDLGATYQSSAERVRIHTGECVPPDVRPTAFHGTLSLGQRYECWAPAVPGPPPRADLYHCGTPDCLKIFDPSEEVQSVLNRSDHFIFAGVVCISVGLLGLLMAAVLWRMLGSSRGAYLASAAGRGHEVAIPSAALTYVTVTGGGMASNSQSPSNDIDSSYSPPLISQPLGQSSAGVTQAETQQR